MRSFAGICISAFLVLAGFSASAVGQTGDIDDPEILRIDTRLVNVPLLVTDYRGSPVSRLKRSNFEVFEDGEKQEIYSFSSTEAPFEVVLLLDTSGSTRADLKLIKRAARNFIYSLRKGDRVSVIAFNSRVEEKRLVAFSQIVTPLTDDRKVLHSGIGRMGTSNGTPFYDGLYQAVSKVFSSSPDERFRGRRALVALTDGVDSTSRAGFDEVRQKLEASGIILYFISLDTREEFEEGLLGDCSVSTQFSEGQIRRYYSLFPSGSRMERVYDFCRIGDFARLDMSRKLYRLAAQQMDHLADLSGGRVFPVAGVREAGAAFREVAREIGRKYSIGYYSSNTSRDGKFRQIRVLLKGLPKGTRIRAREGYRALSN